MAFDKLKEQLKEIQSDSEKAVQSNTEYYKLLVFKILTQTISTTANYLLFGSIIFLIILFVSISGGIALGNYLENNSLGFLIVAGVFLVILCILLPLRKKIIETPILSKMSENYFKEE